MTDADIITALYHKLEMTGGRHLYAVLGHSYRALRRFSEQLQRAQMPDGRRFPAPLSVTRCLLDTIPEDEFRDLVEHEAKRPEPTRAHIQQAFEHFLRDSFPQDGGLLVLESLELLFTYNVDLSYLRGLPTDGRRILLLLPGRREGSDLKLFPLDQQRYARSWRQQLIANHHLWELQD
jgi:hypothetical protein